jgi:hypothetical protein
MQDDSSFPSTIDEELDAVLHVLNFNDTMASLYRARTYLAQTDARRLNLARREVLSEALDELGEQLERVRRHLSSA